ncbi:Aste57867_17261 [Aphanomyces stellatus]|uniref:Aste57867_17261 protein n=1 Tax=Aphanomyces stellatus TaxID=120398 RepID=A0A485L970_9STRA|nr:hypothetical protein As57867_017202 [Aphanomyces stellatus]VFT94017.1 Aste57867_17261 [Aphanomyces stellatus]
MPGATLNESDLERMRLSISDPVQSNREAKRQHLKELSTQRTGKWPNTLEAMRRKKENWKKDKDEREEQERLKIDEEEHRLQKEYRTKQIERANRLLYEQTDRMKTLRSKELLADVLQDREYQIQEKHAIKTMDSKVEASWTDLLMTQLRDADRKSEDERKERERKHKDLVRIQKTQLDAYKQNYVEHLREEMRDGERIKQKAEQDMRDEQDLEAERKRKVKQANEDTRLANERLKLLRKQEAEKEVAEEVKRQEDARKKEERTAKREALQKQREEKKMAQKMRMIDLATENLLRFEAKSEARLENQKREVRQKEDYELKCRADRRAAQKAAIDHSRSLQLEEKQRHKQDEMETAKEQTLKWADYNQRIEKACVKEETDKRLDNIRLAALQRQQAEAKRSTDMEERAAQILAEETIKHGHSMEQELYKQYAAHVLDDAEAKGIKNVYPLKQALKAKGIDLLPASGFRV